MDSKKIVSNRPTVGLKQTPKWSKIDPKSVY